MDAVTPVRYVKSAVLREGLQARIVEHGKAASRLSDWDILKFFTKSLFSL